MTTLLKLTTSLYSANGHSSLLVDRFVKAWLQKNPDDRLIARDLATERVPHLDEMRFRSFQAKPEERTAEQQAVIEYSDSLIDDFRHAQVIVLGLPMYNFGIPSMLKCYFDHVARAGATFQYTSKGPVGLLEPGKKAYIVATRGGLYAGTPKDTQTAYVRDFFNLIGISDVEFVYAEGLRKPDLKEARISDAYKKLEQLIM